MLVLSRKSSETIRFPQLGISVEILSVKGSRVQVGIAAPPEIQVLRKELEPASHSVEGSLGISFPGPQIFDVRSCRQLKNSCFQKTEIACSVENDMVEQFDANNRAGSFELRGDVEVA